MYGDWAHCFILFLFDCSFTAIGLSAARVIMSRPVLKWHTPKWICQFSSEVSKMAAENCALPTNRDSDHCLGLVVPGLPCDHAVAHGDMVSVQKNRGGPLVVRVNVGDIVEAKVRGENSSSWPWVVVLTASLLLSFAHRGLLGVLVTPIEHDLLLNDFQMGAAQGPAYAIMFAISNVAFGRIADIWRRRELLVIGMCIWTGGALLGAFAHGFASLVSARMLAGAGMAAVIPISVAIIGDAFPPEKRGLAYGVFMAGGPLGDALAVVAGGFLLSLAERSALSGISSLASWRQVTLVGAAAVLPLIIFAMCLSEPPRCSDAHATELEADADGSPRYLIRNWRIYLPYALSLAAGAIGGAASYWMPEVLRRTFALRADQIAEAYGTTLLVSSMAGAAVGMIAGKLSANPLRGFLIASTAYTLVAFGFLSFLTASLPLMLASTGFYVVVDSTLAVVLTNTVQAMIPSGLRGTVAALEQFCGTIVGYSIGQPLVGYVSDTWMRGPRGLGNAVMAIMVPTMLAAATLLYLANRQISRPNVPV
jgi:MFS family permease